MTRPTQPPFRPAIAAAVLSAIAASGRQVVYTYPNADPGSDEVISRIVAAAESPDAFCVRSFGAAWYPTAMAHAGMMVGNSSGGIIEAIIPVFHGRLRAAAITIRLGVLPDLFSGAKHGVRNFCA